MDWDIDIISEFEAMRNEMAVLSTQPSSGAAMDKKTGWSLDETRYVLCNAVFEGDNFYDRFLRLMGQVDVVLSIKGSPQLQLYWTGEFSFFQGNHFVDVPYDFHLPMVLTGPDVSLSLRGFFHGYDIYTPERLICFRSSATGKERGGYWENRPIATRLPTLLSVRRWMSLVLIRAPQVLFLVAGIVCHH